MSSFIESKDLYPIKFKPIYQERIWGGSLMNDVLNRETPKGAEPIGESWEISDREDAMSVVENGALAGKTLQELIGHYKENLLGPKANAKKGFPLLVKLIDAGDRLSLQVHPDDEACAKLGGGAEPKTEMWYIVAAQKGAQILAGLSPRATQLQIRDSIDSPEVEKLMQIYPSVPGDAYYIPSGTLHAIGGGNLILEIQQSSDTTYRVSDWGRVDADGNPREIHVEQGLASINFANRTSPRIAGTSGTADFNRKYPVINHCPYFSVDDLRLIGVWRDSTTKTNSFHLISAISGPIRVSKADGSNGVDLVAGDTVFIPYKMGNYIVEPLEEGETVAIKTNL